MSLAFAGHFIAVVIGILGFNFAIKYKNVGLAIINFVVIFFNVIMLAAIYYG